MKNLTATVHLPEKDDISISELFSSSKFVGWYVRHLLSKGLSSWLKTDKVVGRESDNYLRIDGRFACVNSERPVFVMHEAHWIVRGTESWSIGVFLEVVFLACLDVGKVNWDIFVSVISAMDMEGSKGMDKLMNNSAVTKEIKLVEIQMKNRICRATLLRSIHHLGDWVLELPSSTYQHRHSIPWVEFSRWRSYHCTLEQLPW